MSLGRHAEALADWDRVMELNDEPADRVAYRLFRVLCLVRTAHCQRGVDESNAAGSGSPPVEPAGRRRSLQRRLRLRPGIGDGSEGRARRASRALRRSKSFADAAMSWLSRASNVGFFSDTKNREKARADVDLAALRNRADFAELLGGESRR